MEPNGPTYLKSEVPSAPLHSTILPRQSRAVFAAPSRRADELRAEHVHALRGEQPLHAVRSLELREDLLGAPADTPVRTEVAMRQQMTPECPGLDPNPG